jgi:hypothetical protein
MLKPADPGTEPPHEGPAIGELVHQLVDDAKAYAQAEIGVAKAIVQTKIRQLALPAGLLVLALLFGLAAVTSLAVGLYSMLAAGMHPLLAGLLTLVIFAAVAAALAWLAVNRLKRIL